jgi:UDP:flavonoid glycosyltransferase YjiC (YdhE family)
VLVTWAPGGNLPPLLAAAELLRARGHEVEVLASDATRAAAERAGFPILRYTRAAAPDPRVAFERRAEALMAAAAGLEIALDVYDGLREWRADFALVDCMLPAAAAAAEATGTPAASLVHFLYGPARRLMLDKGITWTTDVDSLNATRRALSLAPLGGLAAWESCDLVLVTAPRWFDLDVGFPAKVIHAGPLGIRVTASRARVRPSRVLLSFSTTVMDGQLAAVSRACAAIPGTGLQAVLTLGPAVAREAVNVPPDVEILEWADHDELLATCAAVVTHAGLGTTLRALSHGVPLLMLPLGRDQHVNAARVSELGAGIRLAADDTPEQIRHALTALLEDPEFSASAARLAKRMADDRPDRRAADALEHVTHSRHG